MTRKYVPYKIVEGQQVPIRIVDDTKTLMQLIVSGDAEGYLYGEEASPYLVKEAASKSELLSQDIDTLPWNETSSRGRHVRNALARHVMTMTGRTIGAGYTITIGDIWTLFMEASLERKPLDVYTFGETSYHVAREVFHRAGLELPEITLAKTNKIESRLARTRRSY